MPTPVSVARQCLTEESARALDDAVAVALRRHHTQTTSLHAVSSLLSLSPTSLLRHACLRSTASSPRLHLRALELSVNVSLDRLPTVRSTKPSSNGPDCAPPPVANSLMAAIKRSQANQRRHPDTWQMYQQISNSSANSTIIKVEIKHFILSILDDPIVSRVLGDAGFRSSDLKVSVFNPPMVGKLPIYPPMVFNFPFAFDTVDENLKRVRDVLLRKKGSRRNPLLVGAFADEAMGNFLTKAGNGEVMEGMSVCFLEKGVLEGSFEKLRGVLGNIDCRVLVSVGDFKGLVERVVLEIGEMMEGFGERLWVIGYVKSYDVYMKVLGQFPNLEKDWDLQVLPITAASPSSGGISSKSREIRKNIEKGRASSGSRNGPNLLQNDSPCSRLSSLMGSFVPLGGFFPSPSEFTGQLNQTTQSPRCGLCNENYEDEASAAMKGESGVSKLSDYSVNDDRSILTAKLTVLRNKWNDICRHLHPTKPPSSDIEKRGSHYYAANSHQHSNNNSAYPYIITSSPMNIQRAILPRPNLSYPSISEISNAKSLTENHLESPCSVTSVTTDLGLGTTFAPKDPQNDKFGKNGLNNATPSQIDVRDFKSFHRLLTEKIGRQNEAINTICQAISRCKAGLGSPRGSNQRGDIWLNFIGPDKVGKKKVALALAEIVFGDKGAMTSLDLGTETGVRCPNSIFRGQSVDNYGGNSRGKMGIDCMVDQLSKNPHSVVFLENVEKADYLAQNNLLQAIRTGRIVNSHRKEISTSNAIFVCSSDKLKLCDESLYKKDIVRFSEEKILDAKSLQMQILVRYVDDYVRRTNGTNVYIVARNQNSDTKKRKLFDMNESTLDEPKRAHKGSSLLLDLNLPFEETEDTEYEASVSDTDLENSKAWLEEFSEHVDENVSFQPFDFDKLSNEVFREIDQMLRMTVGPDVVLEIDDDVAVQVIAAAWLSNKGLVENWVKGVLGQSFVEAKERCNNLSRQTIMKLVACEGVCVEEHFIGVCLPSRITFN